MLSFDISNIIIFGYKDMISDKFPNKHGTFDLIRISVYVTGNILCNYWTVWEGFPQSLSRKY